MFYLWFNYNSALLWKVVLWQEKSLCFCLKYPSKIDIICQIRADSCSYDDQNSDNIVVQNFDHDLNRNWNREKWVWRIDFRLGSSCLGRAESTFMRQFFFAGVEIRNTLLRGFMILRTAHFPIFDVVTLDTSLIGRMLKTRGGKLSGN